ncbi:YcxB family protein [Bordetella genomosp. 13]|uniref:YcxB family protein n=1 Tax=Bordetella genomosp. 13 TaxID=463040 RepID=UPI001642ED6E|nr:YcxB family protein [Bordetella genomosp. 13]
MRFTYRYERVDFVRACIALARPSMPRRLAWCVAWLVCMVGFMMWTLEPHQRLPGLRLLATGGFPWSGYAILVGCLLLIWFRAEVLGWLFCAPAYGRTALAGQDVAVELGQDGIWAGNDNVNTRVAWAGVQRIVETPALLLFVISRREGILLPRRAIPSEAARQEALALARARVDAARARYGLTPRDPS